MIHHDGSSLTDRAYDHIRTHVLNGAYAPGQRLVTRQIAGEVGASLNPIREALGRLAAEGLVDHIPGSGAFVHMPTPAEILELYEFREAIEPFAAARAARLITDAELSLLQETCEAQHTIARSLKGNGGFLNEEGLEAWFVTEERFNRAIIHAARNRYLVRSIEQSRLLSRVFQSQRALGVKIDLRITARTWQVHCRLLRALQSRDSEAAAECVRDALKRGTRTVLAAFS